MLPTRPSTNASNNGPSHHHHQRDLTKHPTKQLQLHVWASQKRTWTRAQIDEERTAFFDTRTSGRPEIWQAIRAALEVLWSGGDEDDSDGGLATAQVILTAAGVTIPDGDMTGAVYDSFGARYPLPPEIVSDPTNLVELPTRAQEDEGNKSEGGEEADEEQLINKREDKGKGVLNPKDMIDIKVKLSNRGDKVLLVTISKEDSVRLVAKKIFEESGVSLDIGLQFFLLTNILA